MKSDEIANGPPTNPTKPEGEKRPQFFQNFLTGCTLLAGWGLIQTVRAVTKRIFIKDDEKK